MAKEQTTKINYDVESTELQDNYDVETGEFASSELINSGILAEGTLKTEQRTARLWYDKNNYGATTNGYFIGVDRSDGIVKLDIGSTTNYFKFYSYYFCFHSIVTIGIGP